MTNSNNHFRSSSVNFSMIISEAVYKAVVGVEKLVRLVSK